MIWDMVHDTQQVYRHLVDAYAHPGTIIDLGPFIRKIDEPISPMIFVLSTVFLDNEVTVHVLDNDAAEDEIRGRFLSRHADLKDADVVFVNARTVSDWSTIFSTLKAGTLIHPHQSATAFIKVQNLTDKPEFSLRGPGIKTSTPLSCGPENALLQALSNHDWEYPSGVDVVLYDDTGHMTAILRTTKIQMEA